MLKTGECETKFGENTRTPDKFIISSLEIPQMSSSFDLYDILKVFTSVM